MSPEANFRPPPAQKLTLTGPSGSIEAILEEPAGADARRFAVVCHPHPQFGGTMDNKVVHTIARTLQELGLCTLRFNFRGVGASEGTYAEGVGETDDALAVVDFGLARWAGARPWLAGFSFGSFVALKAANARPQCEQLLTIAPAVQRFDFSSLPVPRCPWLVVQGDADELVDHRAVLEWTTALVPPPRVRILAGVDHYFHGRLHELKDVLREELGAR